MYRDCMITAVSNLGFYGKVSVWYKEKNDEELALKFILNENKSVIGNLVSANGTSIESFNFSTIIEMIEYLEGIRDRIYLIQVA